MNTPTPKESLIAGALVLAPVLEVARFAFEFRGESQGSGGASAWGEFVRLERRLELHYRYSLGLVSYHARSNKVSHEQYMRELGVWERCRYPGFSSEHLGVFHDLAHDLAFAKDFLSGNASVLESAAKRASAAEAKQRVQLLAGYTGDTEKIQLMHVLFKERRYAEVVGVFGELHAPHLLGAAQRRLINIARQRAGG